MKSTRKKHLQKRVKQDKRNKIRVPYILGLVIFLTIIGFIYIYKNDSYDRQALQDRRISPNPERTIHEPKFIKEGELTFINKTTKKE